MIARSPVTDAVLATLRGTGDRVGDNEAPADTTKPYAILETPGGGGPLLEDLGDLNRNLTVRYRVVCVGEDPTSSALARRQADNLSDRLRALLIVHGAVVPPEGASWDVRTVRHDSINGAQWSGPVVNVSDDYVVTVNGR